MNIKCELCDKEIAVADDLADGQHVRCPFCGGKFSYAIEASKDKENGCRTPTGGNLLVKCACCGEQIEVDDTIAIGQHVRCPCCGQKFSYGIENTSGHGVGDVERKTVAKSAKHTKVKVRELGAKPDSHAEALARQKTVVKIIIACSATIVMALLSSFLYWNWHEEKANADRRMAAEKVRRDAIVLERNQRREKLRQRVSECLTNLKRKKSDVIFEINGVSRMMRDKRDAGEDVSSLKSQKEVLRLKQDAIQDALNVFLSAGMRIDIMDSAEIDNTERELAQRMHSLDKALEDAVKRETGAKQEVTDRAQKLAQLNEAGAEPSHDHLSTAGVAVGQFKNQDSETKKLVAVEVRHDIEMLSRKQLKVESQDSAADEPKDVQSIPPSDDRAAAMALNVTTTAAEVKVQENEKPKVVEKQKLRICHKCFGKGTIAETVNEKCDDCEGRGYIVKEVALKDTKHYTDGYRNYKSVGLRTSKSKQNCLRCNHRGRIAVKREKDCPICKGAGFFTKDGIPYKAPVESVAEGAKEVSKWLIPTAEDGGAIWHYTKIEPERSWFRINYDHSKWFDGWSAFSGGSDKLNAGTEWNSQDIYLRKKFKFEGNPKRIKSAKLRYMIDDNLHVWLNETKIAEQSAGDEQYREIDMTKEFVRSLRRGENVIAVWAHDVWGRRNVDVGLFVIYSY